MGRKPRLLVVWKLPKCDRTYGSAPCVATISGGSPTGMQKCFNSFASCQDPTNYLSTTFFELKMCPANQPNPLPGETVHHVLKQMPAFVPSSIDPLGNNKIVTNATLTLNLQDTKDNDTLFDLYINEALSVSGRPPGDPMDRGTLFTKVQARHPYWLDTVLEIKRGYEDMAEADYAVQKYYVQDFVGPDAGYGWKLKAQDILKLGDTARTPQETTGKVADNPLTAGATTVNLDDATDYNDPAVTSRNEYVAIGTEVIQYTGITGNALTGCTRASWETTAAEHEQDTTVQQCFVAEDENVYDIEDRIMQNDMNIAAADIDVTGNEAERDTWLLGWSFTGIITKPTASSEILNELQRTSLSVLFWDVDDQNVKVRALKFPIGEVATFVEGAADEGTNVLDNGLSVNPNIKELITRSFLHFDRRTGVSELKKPTSYLKKEIVLDDVAETNKFGRAVPHTTFSRWIVDEGQASRFNSLIMRRFTGPPRRMTFDADIKDGDLQLFDLVKVETDKVVNLDGTRVEDRLYNVVAIQRIGTNRVKLGVIDAFLTRRYGLISPSGTSDYPSATADQKNKYIWVGDTNNLVGSPPEDGYYIF